MRIVRRGASADHGLKAVELKKLKYKWNPTSETFDVSSGVPATDFSTSGRHNYTLRLTLSELAQLVIGLGADCKAIDAQEFADTFASAVPSLIRLATRASDA